jgi:hypothetical protein
MSCEYLPQSGPTRAGFENFRILFSKAFIRISEDQLGPCCLTVLPVWSCDLQGWQGVPTELPSERIFEQFYSLNT